MFVRVDVAHEATYSASSNEENALLAVGEVQGAHRSMMACIAKASILHKTAPSKGAVARTTHTLKRTPTTNDPPQVGRFFARPLVFCKMVRLKCKPKVAKRAPIPAINIHSKKVENS